MIRHGNRYSKEIVLWGAHMNQRTKRWNDQHGYEELLAKAKAHGSVRVIVRLKLNDWKPEGDLPNEQAAAVQRQAIAHLQARLLKTMTSFGVSDVKQFTFVPQLAMKVNATGLQDLLANPDVTGIWEDMPLAPSR